MRRIATRAIFGLAVIASAGFAATARESASTRHYLYVAVPGSDGDAVGASARAVRLLVFDIDQAHRFVRAIPLWTMAAGADAESVRGTAASTGASRFYIATTKRLAAIDLATDAVVWEQSYDDRCCDRLAVSPDGKTIYAPAFGRASWYVVDAANGALRRTIRVAGWPRQAHVSRDGRFVFLAAWESTVLSVVDAATNDVIRTVGPFTSSLCPFAVNRKGTLAFANVDGLVGFEVGDLQSGLVLDRVAGAAESENVGAAAYECPSHGIAFTPDENELWIADGVSNRVRVFDSSVYPPVLRASIPLQAQPRWIAFDGGGRYAYASTGDVIGASTKTIVGTLKDEHGVRVTSDNFLEIDLADRHPIG